MNLLDIQPDMIDEDLLPQGLQELSEVIGLDAALRLTRAFPGVPLYVPVVATSSHAIAHAIGMEAFETLVDRYAGDIVRLCKLDSAIRQIKHEMRRRMRRAGKSNREIALALNYGQRWVERLGEYDRHGRPQRDLFNED